MEMETMECIEDSVRAVETMDMNELDTLADFFRAFGDTTRIRILRELMEENMKAYPGTRLVIPPLSCCTDNAAMIGAAGYIAYRHGLFGKFDAAADPGMLMPGEEY